MSMTMASAPDRLSVLRAAPRQAGVLLDFDGTLATIVDEPADARPLPGAVDVLRSLVGRYAVVAVVSGRPVAFLREHLDVDGLVLSGLYGLEQWRHGAVATLPDALPWRSVAAAVADRADAELPAATGVERKGLSVGLHFRVDPSIVATVAAWAADVAAETGLVVDPARRSLELRPPLPVDKGTAVLELAAGLSALCFFGDDRGDLAAFAALDRLGQAGATTVRVVALSDETPPEVRAAGDVFVAGPEGALELLASLARDEP
jgi:trehalose 6-phosphate phosphatase